MVILQAFEGYITDNSRLQRAKGRLFNSPFEALEPLWLLKARPVIGGDATGLC